MLPKPVRRHNVERKEFTDADLAKHLDYLTRSGAELLGLYIVGSQLVEPKTNSSLSYVIVTRNFLASL